MGRAPQVWHYQSWQTRLLKGWGLVFLVLASLLFVPPPVFALAQPASSPSAPPSLEQILDRLPAPQVHPLPASLHRWDEGAQEDYFAEIVPTPVGYLIWSQFPVQVYVEPASTSPSLAERDRVWVEQVTQAIAAWNPYLPLELTTDPEGADVVIWRSAPPLQVQNNRLMPVRSAETRYELLIQRPAQAPPRLSHRCTIYLSPHQAPPFVGATARHELGHALGIWGHSPEPTDVLYFSQVRHPPDLSARDITTLKRIYQQPTRLGWELPSPS